MAKESRRAKTSSVKARTKSQMLGDLAENTGLSRKQVASVFDEMAALIKKDLSKRSDHVLPGNWPEANMARYLVFDYRKYQYFLHAGQKLRKQDRYG